MLKETKFSVILPIFNTEKYLKACLDSIINQTYKNLEIICVNDGSTDGSLKILEEYSSKDSRIKIINQQNQGVSAARNAGIDNATGDYVSFVDPDDWLELNMYETLNKYIQEKNPSVLLFEYNICYEQTDKVISKTFTKKMKSRFNIDISNKNRYNFYDFKKDKILFYVDSSCNKVYSTEMLNKYNFRFPPFKKGEDTLFILNIILHKIPVDCVTDVFYNYRIRSGSTITKESRFNTLPIFDKLDYIQTMLKECDLDAELEKGFKKYKLRKIYECEKKCLPELKEEFIKLAKEKMDKKEYAQFIFLKIVSTILRELFSIQKKHYVDNQLCNTYTILGQKINIPCRKS